MSHDRHHGAEALVALGLVLLLVALHGNPAARKQARLAIPGFLLALAVLFAVFLVSN